MWPRSTSSYLVDRPDSVLAALRTVGQAPGAALVHCAAGKDRTGTIVALALSAADADRQAIIDDYVASSERVERVVQRLMASPTYAENLRDRPLSSHLSHPETMISLLRHIYETFGSVPQMCLCRWAGRPRTMSNYAPSSGDASSSVRRGRSDRLLGPVDVVHGRGRRRSSTGTSWPIRGAFPMR